MHSRRERQRQPAVVSTLAVNGFPQDVLPREMRNLCRFCRGFEGSHAIETGSGGYTLFVKFVTRKLAEKAQGTLHGMEFDEVGREPARLRAEIARRDLELRSDAPRRRDDRERSPRSARPSGGAPPPRSGRPRYEERSRHEERPPLSRYEDRHQSRYDDHRSRSRPPAAMQAVAGPGGERVDTLIYKYQDDDDRDAVQECFEDCDGCLGMLTNEKIWAVFAKFEDPDLAAAALERATSAGFEADFAKRSLNL